MHTSTTKKTTTDISISIIENEYVSVIYKTRINTIEVIWKKFSPSNMYRETLIRCYDAIISYKIRYWISDMTYAGVVSIKDQKWVIEEFIPKGIKAGIEKIGIVLSKDIFNQIYTEDVKNSLNPKVFSYFNILSEAEKWMSEK